MEHAGSGQPMVVSSERLSFFLNVTYILFKDVGQTLPSPVRPEVRTTGFVLSLEVRGHLLGTGVAGPIAVVFGDL